MKIKYIIVRHHFGSNIAYQIFVKAGTTYKNLTSKLFKTKLEAENYAKSWINKQ
jgi:hypothetical protein